MNSSSIDENNMYEKKNIDSDIDIETMKTNKNHVILISTYKWSRMCKHAFINGTICSIPVASNTLSNIY